jgi:hygromycin-B 7''-O-kinase
VFLGDDAVIKLFCPTWGHEARIEHDALVACAGRLPIECPRVLARGELDGWPYLVVSRLRGRELGPLWAGLDDAHRRRLVVETAALLAALHRVPTPEGLPNAWAQFELPMQRVLDKHRREHAPPAWLGEIAAALRDEPELDGPTVLLHGDVHPEHLMLGDDGRLCGLFDFADCMRGPAEYDVAATACLMAIHVPDGADTFYRAYGPVDRRRLPPALLRQRYCALTFALAGIPPTGRPDTIADLLALMGSGTR